MAQLNGSTGWLAIGNEAVAYGTLATTLVYQQGIASKPRLVRVQVPTPVLLGTTDQQQPLTIGTYYEVTTTTAHTDEDDDVGIVYAAGSVDGGTSYVFGTGTANTGTSCSIFADYGGVEYDFAGCIPKKYTWNLNNDGHSTLDIDWICQSCAKYGGAARTPSIPPASEIILPSALATFTVNTGTAIGSLTKATITVERNVTGWDRLRLGGSTLVQPIVAGPHKVNASFVCELDSAASNTVSLLDEFIANTDLGTVVCDNFSLAMCYIEGDFPEQAAGLRPITLNVRATSLTVTTS